MTDKTKPISASNPPESKGVRSVEEKPKEETKPAPPKKPTKSK